MIRVGSSIGASATLLLVLASGVLGVLCIRLAGLTTALNVRKRMAQGEVPNGEMLNGLVLVVAGGLLFLPGFISDAIGLVCLLPITRSWLIKRIAVQMTQGAGQTTGFYSTRQTYRQRTNTAQIIEGEFERKDS
jgi:UPF0716 protein FxsA